MGVGAVTYLSLNDFPKMPRYHLGKPKEYTIYEANSAVGLMLVAKLLLFLPSVENEATILIDNQAALKLGERPTMKPGHYILHFLQRLIHDVKCKHNLIKNQINICWIPGYKGIQMVATS